MALKFQVRGTQLDAWFAKAYPFHADTNQNGLVSSVQANASPGVFGSSVISLSSGYSGLSYVGLDNFTLNGSFSLLFRIVPKWTGVPPDSQGLLGVGISPFFANVIGYTAFGINADGIPRFTAIDEVGNYIFNGEIGSTPLTFTNGVPTDIWLTWDGSTTAGAIKLYQAQNGVAPTLIASANAINPMTTRRYPFIATMTVAAEYILFDANNYTLNELCIWDTQIDPIASFGARSTFISAANVYGYNNTDPGLSNVLSGVGYISAGVSEVGTLLSSDPGIANVAQGTSYQINSAARTGTLVVPGPSTDPGVTNVKSGIAYEISGANKTGTLVNIDPGVLSVATGVYYEINNVPLVGQLNAVTNLLVAPTLIGQSLVATLMET
jgi:hypothetical protein